MAYPCHARANQRFRLQGQRILVEGLCLDAAGEGRTEGTKVIAYPCHQGANQRWFADGTSLRSELNGKCLDIGKNGNKLELHSCDGSLGQRFYY
ncbi:ricin-type beta-trefoil lectin domain protein [Mesocricetibacter intestinalis]|uniref:ricin-type beta-trefoil lectin domain protein n=1 Tax=Mesocricetibacter intestinalis TaxID=1521930 RepID=UPI001FB6163C